MTNSTCPNCGKPIRPGAKFCGSCGNAISTGPVQKAQPPTPTPGAAPAAGPAVPAGPAPAAAAPGPTPPAGAAACPKCGQPVRPDARFCPHCGSSISRPATPTPPPAAQPTPAPAAQKPSITSPAPAAPAAAAAPSTSTGPRAQVTPPAPVPQPKKSFLRKYWWLLLILGVVLCLGFAAGGYFIFKDDLKDLFKKEKATATPTEKATKPKKETDTPSPTLEEVTKTLELTPTFTPTKEVLATITATTAISTPVSLAPPLEGEATLTPTPAPFANEYFSGTLDVQWVALGGKAPEIKDGHLELKGNSTITSKAAIQLAPSTSIRFQVRVLSQDKQNVVVFDWDVGEGFRQPKQAPGLIHMEIGNNLAKLIITPGPTCQQQLTDTEFHTYEIVIELGNGLTFNMDSQKVCNITIPDPGLGRISLSGKGWVDNIEINVP